MASKVRYISSGLHKKNLDMPHFGGEQPGDTSYYSPLIINGFGVVDYIIVGWRAGGLSYKYLKIFRTVQKMLTLYIT